MKNLVFGALISALSFSAFASGSMHTDHTDLLINIESTGTEVNFVPCANTVGPSINEDGNKLTQTATGYEVSLNSLHYGSSFTVCARFELEGGYVNLTAPFHVIKLKGFLGVDAIGAVGQSDYVSKSGLKMFAHATCVGQGDSWREIGTNKTLTPVAVAVADQMLLYPAGPFNVDDGFSLTGAQGLPSACEVAFTFTETSSAQREETSGHGVALDISLDVNLMN